jgi:fatty acid desaturase
MASLDRQLTAVPVSAPRGRWSEYAQLSRQDEAGRPAGASWRQLAFAAHLAVVFTQLAFVGHDAGHRQLFRSRRAAAPFVW